MAISIHSRQSGVFLCLALIATLAIPAGAKDLESIEELRLERKKIAHQQRRLIANNDGCDCLYFPKDTEPTAENIVADFNDTEFLHDGTITRFRIEQGQYYINVTEKDGVATDYKVHSVAGIEPLQQYLLETEPGKIQSFDVVWDTVKTGGFTFILNKICHLTMGFTGLVLTRTGMPVVQSATRQGLRKITTR